jgi:hypothetical protein
MKRPIGNSAAEILNQGSRLLEPLFSKYGFVYVELKKGESSGGQFASGEFRRVDRRFEFHFRDSLGLVIYHQGSRSISHVDFMHSVLGKLYASHYPGFSKEPLDAFRNLSRDLEEYCHDFFERSDEAFLRRIEDACSKSTDRLKLPE